MLGVIEDMTLLTTEVHRSARGDIVVFAADRRISRGQAPAGTRQKVFRIPEKRAGDGYFGLAEVPTRSGRQPMSERIQDFFYQIQTADTLANIAERLTLQLNTDVPKDCRDSEVSGLHLAGLRTDDQAEFWFIRNIDDMGNLTRTDYQFREDFQSRDASGLPSGAAQIYRNGDIRAHVVAWGQIDQSLGLLLGTHSFRALQSTDDYVEWVQFKMELVAGFHERFATESVIGQPIDAFAIHK